MKISQDYSRTRPSRAAYTIRKILGRHDAIQIATIIIQRVVTEYYDTRKGALSKYIIYTYITPRD